MTLKRGSQTLRRPRKFLTGSQGAINLGVILVQAIDHGGVFCFRVPLDKGLQKTIDYFRKELERTEHSQRNIPHPKEYR